MADDNEDGLIVFPALQVANLLNRISVERIGPETVESVSAKGDDAATFDGCVDSFEVDMSDSHGNRAVRREIFIAWKWPKKNARRERCVSRRATYSQSHVVLQIFGSYGALLFNLHTVAEAVTHGENLGAQLGMIDKVLVEFTQSFS